MTPLHWAAYQGDSDMVQLLLDSGARQYQTILGNTPVDIAGFCKNTEVVLTFCQELDKRIQQEVATGMPDRVVDEEAQSNQVAPEPGAEGVQAYDEEGNPIEADLTKTVIKCKYMKR